MGTGKKRGEQPHTGQRDRGAVDVDVDGDVADAACQYLLGETGETCGYQQQGPISECPKYEAEVPPSILIN